MGNKITVAKYDIDIESISKKLAQLKSSLDNEDLGKGMSKKFSKEIASLEKDLAGLEKNMPGSGASVSKLTTYGNKVDDVERKMSDLIEKLSGFKITDDYLQNNIKGLKAYVDKLKEAQKELADLANEKLPQNYEAKTKNVGSYGVSGRVNKAQNAMKTAALAGKKENIQKEYDKVVEVIQGKMESVKKLHGEDHSIYQSLASDLEAMKQLKIAYEDLADVAAPKVDAVNNAMEELKTQTTGAGEKLKTALSAPTGIAGELSNDLKQVSADVNRWTEATERADEASRTFDNIANRLKNLTSAGTVFGFIGRTIRKTVSDMLELDKQFNEIAIVSDYSTKEMWKSFDSVNRVAQQFGVETKNVLEVQNLYYHQGKSMAEVNKLTAQTLTLAKITGMDYAKTTSHLTAVLNAYNIAAEDAVRVTDTIAAMDTNAAISSEELMTALTKTASIAANAGMSLESTEIFLTKMIETTREAPENLGTALKTIVARFGEVKQEIDGEVVELANINRVDAALKSVGISLTDSVGQIRDLDDVFMELSAQWDGLDRNTQRYIATIAAGSRQQSRFIAMMEDYDRTLELTDVMQNSAGIGAKQLEKSQESLETSINRLKSSLQELASSWVQAGTIKQFIEMVNSLVNALNTLHPITQAVVVGLGLYILKFKILNPLLSRYRIIQQGIVEGLDREQIQNRLNNQEQTKTIFNWRAIIGLLSKGEKGIEDTTKKTKKQTDEQEKNNKALEENIDLQKEQNNVTKARVKRKKDPSGKKPRKNDPKPEAPQEPSPPPSPPEKTPQPPGLKDKIKNTFKENYDKGRGKTPAGEIVGDTAKGKLDELGDKAKTKTKDVLTSVKKKVSGLGKNIISGLGKFMGKFVKFITNPIVAGITAAIAAVAITASIIWKKNFAASLDDTKQVENLGKAQDEYNKTLQEYNNLKKNAAKYEKTRNKLVKTADELQEEQAAAQAIVEEYPQLLDYIDEEGNLHLRNTEIINEEIEAKKKLLAEESDRYFQMKIKYTREGIYADESTGAGSTMSSLKSFYSSQDEKSLKEMKKEIDKGAWIDGGKFKKFAEAYASGEKTSFSHKDFSNLFAGSLTEQEFKMLAQAYSENGGDMRAALEETDSYSVGDIEKVAVAWQNLNEATGGLYDQLLSNIGTEIEDIYVQEARIDIERIAGDQLTAEQKEDAAQSLAAYRKQVEKEVGRLVAWNDKGTGTIGGVYAKNIIDGTGTTFTRERSEYTSDLNYYKNGKLLRNTGDEDRTQDLKDLDYLFNAKENYGTYFEWEWGNYEQDDIDKVIQKATNDYESAMEQTFKFMASEEGALLKQEYDDFYRNFGSTRDFIKYTDTYTTYANFNETTDEYSKYKKVLGSIANQAIVDFETERSAFAERFSSAEGSIVKIGEDTTNYADTIAGYINRLTPDELKRTQEIFSTLGNDAGSAFVYGYGKILDSELSENVKNVALKTYMGTDFTNTEDVLENYVKLKNILSETSVNAEDAQEALKGFISTAGTDAILFTDMSDAIEKLNNRLEKMKKEYEGLLSLAQGTGDLQGALGYFENLRDSAEEAGDTLELSEISEHLKKFEATSEGLKLVGDEDLNSQIEETMGVFDPETVAQMRFSYGIAQELEAKQDRGVALTTEEETALNEATTTFEATYLSLMEQEIMKRQLYIDQLKEELSIRQEIVKTLLEYDYYRNLNAQLDDLNYEKNNLEFEIEFSYNSDSIKENTLELINNTNKQIAANQAGLTAARQNTGIMRDAISKNYGSYVNFDDQGAVIVNNQKMLALEEQIAQAKLAGKDEVAAALEAERDAIETSISAYEEARKKSQDYAKSVQQNFQELEKIMQGVYQDLADAESKILEVIQQMEDKEVEQTREKYDKIKAENDKYLNSLRDMIDKEREIRDRQKQEEDVKDKEKKLAMMKMDASGTYASEIQALEEELEQDYQDLEDAAIDKKLQEMEDEFTTQQEQLDKDIEYMENALKYKRESYANYQAQVNEILTKGSDEALEWILANDEKYAQETAAKQKLLRDDYQKTMSAGVAANEIIAESLFTKVITTLEGCKTSAGNFETAVESYSEEVQISSVNGSKAISGVAEEYGILTGKVEGLTTKIGLLSEAYGTLADAASNAMPNFASLFDDQLDDLRDINDQLDTFMTTINQQPDESYSKGSVIRTNDQESIGAFVGEVRGGGWTYRSYKLVDVSDGYAYFEIDGEVYGVAVMGSSNGKDRFRDSSGVLEDPANDLTEGHYYQIHENLQLVSAIKKHAKGGLVNYTGPSWLDGSKSKPEMVLDPAQTRSFIQLVDVLDYMRSPAINSQKSYENVKNTTNADTSKVEYNINVEVSQMSSDYDVDQMLNRMEEKLLKESRYKNVTKVMKI